MKEKQKREKERGGERKGQKFKVRRRREAEGKERVRKKRLGGHQRPHGPSQEDGRGHHCAHCQSYLDRVTIPSWFSAVQQILTDHQLPGSPCSGAGDTVRDKCTHIPALRDHPQGHLRRQCILKCYALAYPLHFMSDEVNTQRGRAICPRSHSKSVGERSRACPWTFSSPALHCSACQSFLLLNTRKRLPITLSDFILNVKFFET